MRGLTLSLNSLYLLPFTTLSILKENARACRQCAVPFTEIRQEEEEVDDLQMERPSRFKRELN